ncbi:MAG: PqqD family protein [Clostridia bacterium]|nr:PqqD family protein [Clostridia bacterium]
MKKQKTTTNYMVLKPSRNPQLKWSEENGAVTLELENKGIMNRIFQFLLRKPKISYIHLEEIGSFVWPLLDGEKTIEELGVLVKENFGEKAEPIYERLIQYFKILESHKFIVM